MVFDTQNEQPRHRIQLWRVGIKNLKTFVITERSGLRHHLIPKVEIAIDLPADVKGIHMSRLVESMTEVLSDEFSVHSSVEELQIHILQALHKKHPFKRGEVKFDFEFGYASKTPVSKKRTWEVCDITASTLMEDGQPTTHSVELSVIGNTVCPHCAANNGGLTHMQRAVGRLKVTGTTPDIPTYGTMIDIIERSFSSRTYSLLKLEDEVYVTREMHDNPVFVEDVCRNILQNAKETLSGRNLDMCAEAISLESIHKHDVIAQGRLVLNGGE
ncbi:MAG: GTP cyclohydrolase I FolE2 [Candidatus Thorarchaeota archaeon]|nr:GTP cyclohydrolase I FolE2 [Candidatus Thorarchaeota archaeon]